MSFSAGSSSKGSAGSGSSAAGLGVLHPGTSSSLASLRGWLALQIVLGLQPSRATRLVRDAIDPWAALHGSGEGVAFGPNELDAHIATLRRIDAVGIPVLSAAYPQRLHGIDDAPPLLWLQGDVGCLNAPAVAIVGARAATPYGLGVARELAYQLARAGVVIVSGLARGIDRVAHEGALDAGGATIAVQARGPDDVYPAGHRPLAARIARQGAMLTEFAPGTAPLRPYFPLRNRLISGLSRVVVVVEARLRSGSLHTARHGLQQGVEVMAVPGEIDAATSEGTNRLLRDGAAPVLGVTDVLDRLGWDGRGGDEWRPESESDGGAEGAGPLAQRVWQALGAGPLDREVLMRELACAARDLAVAVVELELDGRVVSDRKGRLRRLAAR